MLAALPVAATGEMTVQLVPLDAIPASWDQAWDKLTSFASEPNPFAERWFMQSAIRNLKTTSAARMIAVWHGKDLIGLLPVTEASRYGRMPIRHVENWLHYHCFYGAPSVRAGDEVAFWTTALAHLDEASWAPNFFHAVGLDPDGPIFAGLKAARRTDIVHTSERAMLRSKLDPAAYFETNVRQKKRKELRRLRSRLDELGEVAFKTLSTGEPIDPWIDAFLALEASGWKGREGSALNGTPATASFFADAVRGCQAAGKLEMLSLTLDDKPIAMLINFMTPPGSFAFKIAFDENYARFSPGVLIKIENLKVLNRAEIEWTDSCAVEDHPMINSLWAERRQIVRATVPLRGAARQMVFTAARSAERLSATLRGRR